jgi:hypothetical protein
MSRLICLALALLPAISAFSGLRSPLTAWTKTRAATETVTMKLGDKSDPVKGHKRVCSVR